MVLIHPMVAPKFRTLIAKLIKAMPIFRIVISKFRIVMSRHRHFAIHSCAMWNANTIIITRYLVTLTSRQMMII